jgi:hypothetical protein
VPSPFPGMDPHLEDPEFWRDAHHRFITATSDQLQPLLNGRGYYVSIESRVWLERPELIVYPDVALLRAETPPKHEASSRMLLTADEPVLLELEETGIHEDYLQIHETETGKLVTGIEFVSPSNKAHGKGRALYVRKRKELRRQRGNQVEVDLLRAGEPLVRLPKAVLVKIQSNGYVVTVICAGSLKYEFFPITLGSRLPRVGIPLKSSEPDVVLDLQTALAHVYESGAYALRIDYTRGPVPALNEEQAHWANELPVAARLREPANAGGPSNGPEPPME